eukprot:266457-Rhodomonas_salina.2
MSLSLLNDDDQSRGSRVLRHLRLSRADMHVRGSRVSWTKLDRGDPNGSDGRLGCTTVDQYTAKSSTRNRIPGTICTEKAVSCP